MSKPNQNTNTKTKSESDNGKVSNNNSSGFKKLFHKLINDKISKVLISPLVYIICIVVPLYLKTAKPYVYSIGLILLLVILRTSIQVIIEYKTRVKLIFLIIFISLLSISTVSYIVYKLTHIERNPCDNPETLYDYYNCGDFPYMEAIRKSSIVLDSLNIPVSFYMDFDANVYFLAFYIPESNLTYHICNEIADKTKETIYEFLSKKPYLEKKYSDKTINQIALCFGGRIFIYHETYLLDHDRKTLDTLFNSLGYSVIFRDEKYIDEQQMLERNERHIWVTPPK